MTSSAGIGSKCKKIPIDIDMILPGILFYSTLIDQT